MRVKLSVKGVAVVAGLVALAPTPAQAQQAAVGHPSIFITRSEATAIRTGAQRIR